jgi:hypothetical protein
MLQYEFFIQHNIRGILKKHSMKMWMDIIIIIIIIIIHTPVLKNK